MLVLLSWREPGKPRLALWEVWRPVAGLAPRCQSRGSTLDLNFFPVPPQPLHLTPAGHASSSEVNPQVPGCAPLPLILSFRDANGCGNWFAEMQA